MAEPAEKPKRKPWDPNTQGYGKHKYEYIDPNEVDLDPGPPGGVRSRDFTTAYNHKHPETTMTIDLLARPGTVFRTNAPSLEGEWVVTWMPVLKNGEPFCRALRAEEVGKGIQPQDLSMVDLGVVANRVTAMFTDAVKTEHMEGGTAGKEIRERLTKQNYKPRLLTEEEVLKEP